LDGCTVKKTALAHTLRARDIEPDFVVGFYLCNVDALGAAQSGGSDSARSGLEHGGREEEREMELDMNFIPKTSMPKTNDMTADVAIDPDWRGTSDSRDPDRIGQARAFAPSA
jgi:hypothetical protein